MIEIGRHPTDGEWAMAGAKPIRLWLAIVCVSLIVIGGAAAVELYEPRPTVDAASLKTHAYEAALGVVEVFETTLGRVPIDRVEADHHGMVKIYLNFEKDDYIRDLSPDFYVGDSDGAKLAADIAINVFGRVLETENLWVLDINGRPLDKFTREDYETAKENAFSVRVRGWDSLPGVVSG